ncbi:ras GTPase-activating protein-binding protein 1 [Cajanus cajan]|nr:ras GTPase-activating protein-binding protein 1 [Cajanus cajan]XP_020226946.1 ras GTPase-activating protein-binding protein 1 [Cajanus cajan]XP_020226947.1 ras GTPase-activating protein-binding protein 1 [Cajanus cajan]XP_029129237.1 ras GTPase-activating protein-binding protein 1 [Cajanus cajan]
MAMPETSPATTPSAQVVGNAFVEQYYHILHQSPNLVHRFYQDSSFLSRSDSNGVMTTVTTTKEINEKIISLNYEDYTAEIKTADAQESYEKGVIVLVTGCLTGKDNVRRKFSQTFFLAPQDKGYYVLNDVFRYIEENDTPQLNSASVNVINENAEAVHVPESEDMHAPEHLVEDTSTLAEGENLDNGAEVYNPQDEDEGSVIDEEVAEPPTDLSQNDVVTVHDSTSAIQDDAPRRSYAAIVMKSNTASGHVYVPSRAARMASAKPSEQWPSTAKSTPAPEAYIGAPSSDSVPGSSDVHEEVEGHSIYIRNLPFNATVEQLEEVFKKFGPIKHGGIQVRSSKHGFCFGFVEFEDLSSMHSALEASPITVGERQAVVEEKRTTTRVSGSGRGRYPSGRGGFRSDSFRARGKFGGGRGYGRNEFRNQGEFSGQPRSSQRPNQNGGGRGGRQGVGNRNATPPASAA